MSGVKTALDREAKARAKEMADVQASVIYEVIRREGERELRRPSSALFWSGVSAGLAISTSVIAKGFLVSVLPHTEWTPIISNFGYTIGFLIVILGRMQLFTENTITPVLTLLHRPSLDNFLATARLWSIVLAANLLGCLISAALLVYVRIVPDPQMQAIQEISRHYAAISPLQHLAWGMPAGFLIAALVWVLPRLDDAGEVLMIIVLTYVIGLGGLSHVVAGSTELFVEMLEGELPLVDVLLRGILPALAGNVLGGTGIFAALTYAQVREEVRPPTGSP